VARATYDSRGEVSWWRLPSLEWLGARELDAWVRQVAVSPDGRWIAVARGEGGASLIEVATARVRQELLGVTSLAFTPDSEVLLTSGGAGTTWWDVSENSATSTIPEHGRLAIRGDGAVLLTGSRSIFIAPDGSRLDLGLETSAQGELSTTGDLAVVPGGTIAWVWDLHRRRIATTLEGHAGVIHQATFAPDGERVATCSDDGTVRVWESRTGRLLQVFSRRKGPIVGCAFSRDGERLLTTALADATSMLDVHLEDRAPDEVARLVAARSTWRFEDGRLVARSGPRR
jgi:WD40 repeat protein